MTVAAVASPTIAVRPNAGVKRENGVAPALVTARTIAPSAANAVPGWRTTNSRPYVGEMARRIAGSRPTWTAPTTPSTKNHTAITGPNHRATAAVPNCCTANSATRMTSAIGTTADWTAGAATSTPPTAE